MDAVSVPHPSVEDREAEEENNCVEAGVRRGDVAVREMLIAPLEVEGALLIHGVMQAEASLQGEIEIGATRWDADRSIGQAATPKKVGGKFRACPEIILQKRGQVSAVSGPPLEGGKVAGSPTFSTLPGRSTSCWVRTYPSRGTNFRSCTARFENPPPTCAPTSMRPGGKSHRPCAASSCSRSWAQAFGDPTHIRTPRAHTIPHLIHHRCPARNPGLPLRTQYQIIGTSSTGFPENSSVMSCSVSLDMCGRSH